MSTEPNATTKGELASRPNGPVVAAFIATGLGSAAMGLATVLAVISEGAKNAMNLWGPAGPLSGKSSAAVVVFIVSWIVLHFVLRKKEANFSMACIVAFVLLGLGLLLTFPPVFELFHTAPAH